MIRTVELSKLYRRSRAWGLKDVSCTIEPGRVTGLLGRNGSGKTTFARLLVGLLKPTSGFIEIQGKRMSAQARSPIPIGYVPQIVPAFPGVTGNDLVEFVLATHGYWGQRLRTARCDVLARLNIQQLGQKLVWNMSGGESRLILIAAALSFRPPLLVLDEPSTGLDVKNRRLLWSVLDEVIDGWAPTVLLVTHDVRDAEGLIEDVIILGQGKIILQGVVAQVRRSYASYLFVSVVSSENLLEQHPSWRREGADRWTRTVPEDEIDSVLAEVKRYMKSGAAEVSVRAASLEDILLADPADKVLT